MHETDGQIDEIFNFKSNGPLFRDIHSRIIKFNPKVTYRIFPVYVKYFLEDNVAFLVFFRGKFAPVGEIDIGINIPSKPTIKGIKEASYMKDRNVTYSLSVKSPAQVKALFDYLSKSFSKTRLGK